MIAFPKDPDSVLDYVFDWQALSNGTGESDWLQPAETIDTHQITIDTGLTLDSSQLFNASTAVRVWLSAGTPGERYKVACKITTSLGRVDERTMIIRVMER